MVGILFQVTSLFFVVALVLDALFYLKLFEEKDYSARRLFIHLRETRRGKSLITGRVTILKWLLIFSYVSTVYSTGLDFYFHLLVFFFYLVLFLNVVRRIVNREVSLPKVSKIAAIVFVLTMGVEFILLVFSPIDRFLWLLIADKLLLVFITLFIILLSVFVDFGRDVAINHAIDKIRRNKRLLTVAIVGSYGRGSTKEFIHRILSISFNVLLTRTSYASSLGIAATINHSLSAQKQIFIADIDDYKKEDVADICQLIEPKIVVVTGINEQKLSAFKTIKNIVDSKREAVNSLSRDGIVLINGGSEHVKELIAQSRNKKFTYKLTDKDKKADISAFNIREEKYSISFDVSVKGATYKLSGIRLLGRQNIESLLPAIFIGVYAGIDFSKIRRELNKIRPLPGSMAPLRTSSGITLIDDTYNANINSVTRALSYMSIYRGKKILVVEPLVELGKNSKQVHFDLGLEMGKSCDLVFLTNDNYIKSVLAGVAKSGGKTKVTVAPPSKIIRYITKECKIGDVAIFEGREAGVALSGIKCERIY